MNVAAAVSRALKTGKTTTKTVLLYSCNLNVNVNVFYCCAVWPLAEATRCCAGLAGIESDNIGWYFS